MKHSRLRVAPAAKPGADAASVTVLKGDRWFRAQGPVFAVALLVLIIAGGTLGYMVIEGWSAWDAFYMTVITVTTVGYREVHDLSRAGQAFTVVAAARRRRRGALHVHAARHRRRRRRPARSACSGAGTNVCSTRSRITSSSAATAASAASSPSSSGGRTIPYVVIERDAERAAGGDRGRRAGRRGRRQPRRRAEARRHRPRARADRGGRHRRRERLRRAERARACGPTCSSSAAPRPRTRRSS